MTGEKQRARFGISAQPTPEGKVLLELDGQVALEPAEARRFAFELAGAYYRAERLAGAKERCVR